MGKSVTQLSHIEENKRPRIVVDVFFAKKNVPNLCLEMQAMCKEVMIAYDGLQLTTDENGDVTSYQDANIGPRAKLKFGKDYMEEDILKPPEYFVKLLADKEKASATPRATASMGDMEIDLVPVPKVAEK